MGKCALGGVQNATTTPIIVNIPSTGLHTVNVWMRESGTIIDRVLLTRDGGFVPSGNGPAETPQTADSGADGVFLPKVDDRSMIVVEAENYRQTTAASNGPVGSCLTMFPM
ncbi:MAG: hypothetical protein IPM37_12490 [Hahellaceae bacterium]|nr:hypothetical protein [Hahellaceae bacterium]